MPDDLHLGLLALLTAGSGGYSLVAAWAAWRFSRRKRAAPPAARPLVSILKPVRGPDPAVYAGLRSHAELEYPDLEILAAADSGDAVLAGVRRLAAERPDRRIAVIPAEPSPGGNPKVALLEELAAAARGELLLIGDADIVVPPDLLDHLVAELERPGISLVTCLYRATPGRTVASRVDALWVSTEFPGQALLGEAAMGGLRFAFGAAMLLRRRDLEALGGFAAIRPYLADDYQLGARIAAAGGRVALSREVVETRMGDSGWRSVWRRHLRWSRNIRVSRPGGHFGLFWTFTTVWSVALAAASGGAAPWSLVAGVAFAGRLLAARTAAVATGFRGFWKQAAWLPLMDVGAAAVWLASFASRDVTWRGRRLRLDRQGRIE